MCPALLLLATFPAAPPEPVKDLRVPAGFSAHLYADNPVAPDVYTMTIDAAGRVLIAGRGYVRVLVDDNGDGTADRAVDLIDGLKEGPTGLLAEGEDLYVVVDGGLKRYRGYNGKDKLSKPELVLSLKTGGEHDAHAVRRGPDGWLYLLCGNMAGVRKETVTSDHSPVKSPTAGALLRLSPDFKQVEVVADGFRNPYSFDFNLDGEPFTYDSDNERCVGLPWYEGCRFYHVVPGGNHGWRSPQLSQTWRKPPHFPDVVPPVCDTGRGSPTGVACYRHTQFPPIYRGDFFLADWTFGRIYWVLLKPSGSSYAGKLEVFAEAVGTSGFAPTALAVHPKTGELYVSIGGRGTRGGVYRIRYDKAPPNPEPLPMATRTLGFQDGAAAKWLSECTSDQPRARREALDLLTRWGYKATGSGKLAPAIKANLTHTDPLVRRAAARLAQVWHVELGKPDSPLAGLELALSETQSDPRWAVQVALETLESKSATGTELLLALRVVQLACGDLTARDAVGTAWEGYTLRNPVPDTVAGRLIRALRIQADRNTGHLRREVALEIARVMGALGNAAKDDIGAVTLTQIDRTSSYRDDLHYLLAFAQCADRAARPGGPTVANDFFAMLTKAKRDGALTDRHWPLRLTELVGKLAGAVADFNASAVANPAFGQPEHSAFAGKLSPPEKVAERFVAVAERDPNYAWTPATVGLLDRLPVERKQKVLRELWGRPGLDEAIVRELARDPEGPDHGKFVAGLGSLDPNLVSLSARALTKLAGDKQDVVYIAAIRALRRFPDEKQNASVRDALSALLQKRSGEKLGADAKAWTAWVLKRYPGADAALNATDGFDAKAWGKRLAGIDWANGDPGRGKLAFAKATCAACHDGGRAVGPSLLGIAKRFSRDDLLTAILQPNKDVSARYRPTRVVTTQDTVVTGIIVYEAVDGVILQTGADTTVRVAGAQIASKKVVDVSLMPAGLLDKLSDAEITDLLAYLGTLK